MSVDDEIRMAQEETAKVRAKLHAAVRKGKNIDTVKQRLEDEVVKLKEDCSEKEEEKRETLQRLNESEERRLVLEARTEDAEKEHEALTEALAESQARLSARKARPRGR